MIKMNVSIDNMLGYRFPLFLNNSKLNNAYYMYEILSPGLSEDCLPLISITKVGEKTKSDPSGSGCDIISVCTGNKANKSEETRRNFLESILKEETEIIDRGEEFPAFEMTEGNNQQKSLVIGLRDSLRWQNYRFAQGRFVDIMWTPTEFALFGICCDNDSFWLEFKGLYSMSDAEMINPLKVKIDVPKLKFPKKASEVNRAIKKMEWEAFDRESLC